VACSRLAGLAAEYQVDDRDSEGGGCVAGVELIKLEAYGEVGVLESDGAQLSGYVNVDCVAVVYYGEWKGLGEHQGVVDVGCELEPSK